MSQCRGLKNGLREEALFAHRQSRRSAQAQAHYAMELHEFQHKRPRGRILPVYASYKAKKPFQYMAKFKQSDGSRILSPAEKQLYSPGENLFATVETLWMSHVQREVRWGLCCAHLGVTILLGGKKSGIPGQTSRVFFFIWKRENLFLCQMKWENCAWWVRWELVVPPPLNCTADLTITGGTTFPATCLLTIWGFTCWEF